MSDTGNAYGPSLAAALGLLALGFVVHRLAPEEKVVASPRKEASRDASEAGLT
jgi:hypothetical protein